MGIITGLNYLSTKKELIMNRLFLIILVLVVPCEGDSVNDGSSVGGGDSVGDVSSATFVEIPEGSFIMRSSVVSKGESIDESQVPVKISKSFEIMSTEVTQKQWFEVMGGNPSYYKRSEDCSNHDDVNNICPDHPVERVSWDDVQEFIKKLNDSKGLEGCDGTVRSARGCYRLPTDAEWEYAMRAGTYTTYFCGEDVLEDYAWYEDNSAIGILWNFEILWGFIFQRTHKVGQKLPNPWGLYDVYGNVAEWVQDVYNDELPGGIDPLNLEENFIPSFLPQVSYVIRGGSYFSSKTELSSASRSYRFSRHSTKSIGFRLVRTL